MQIQIYLLLHSVLISVSLLIEVKYEPRKLQEYLEYQNYPVKYLEDWHSQDPQSSTN